MAKNPSPSANKEASATSLTSAVEPGKGLMTTVFHETVAQLQGKALTLKKLTPKPIMEMFVNCKQVRFKLAGKITNKLTKPGNFDKDTICFHGEFAARITGDGKEIVLLSNRLYVPEILETSFLETLEKQGELVFNTVLFTQNDTDKRNARGYVWLVESPKVSGQKSIALTLLDESDSQQALPLS